MKAISQMSLGELAAFVCSHLDARGIKVVLSGGGCVAIYASDRCSSLDLDFIDRLADADSHEPAAVRRAMTGGDAVRPQQQKAGKEQ
jgi:hypothetical protein